MTIKIPRIVDTEEINFLPCPFCGRDPGFRKTVANDGKYCYVRVMCGDGISHDVEMEEKFLLGTIGEMPVNIIKATERLAKRWNTRYNK